MTQMQTFANSGPAGAMPHWLHALRVTNRPVGLLHVGAGGPQVSAANPLHAIYEHAVQVLAVEADATKAAQLKAARAATPHVQVRQALVAPEAGRRKFFKASVNDESGLCTPEDLHAVWPRLKALRTEDVDTVSLAQCWKDFTADCGEAPALPNWLFVDCFPAAELLAASPELLTTADVVVARAVQPSAAMPGTNVPARLTINHIQALLATHGLNLLGLQEENHPALVLAVFVRGQQQRSNAQAEKSAQENYALLEQQAATARAQLEQLAAAKGRAEQQLVELKTQTEQQTAALKAELERQVATARAQLEQLAAAKGQAEQQLVELKTQTEQQTAALKAQLEQQAAAALKVQIEQHAQREQALQQELREARQTAALGVRLQMLREADLKDLQGRYQVATAAQERQHQLLTKLSERLTAASAYFHQLSNAQAQVELLANGAGTKRRRRATRTEATQPREGAKKGAQP